MKIGHDSAHEMNSAPVVTDLAAALPIMRLPSPAITAASSGRKTMNRIKVEVTLHPHSSFPRRRESRDTTLRLPRNVLISGSPPSRG
jgi:hypothetical protein